MRTALRALAVVSAGIMALALGTGGCLRSEVNKPDDTAYDNPCDLAGVERLDQVTAFPFYVYHEDGSSENHFTLNRTSFANPEAVHVQTGCPETPFGSSCVRIECDFTEQPYDTCAQWHWEAEEAQRGKVNGGYNLSRAHRITFWTRAEHLPGRVSFFIGGLGECRPFPDTVMPNECVPCAVPMDTVWTRHTYPLTELNGSLCRVIGGFSFKVWRGQVSEPFVFYLDEICYE